MRLHLCSWVMAAVVLAAFSPGLSAQDLLLQDLVSSALQNNPEIKAADAKAAAMAQKVPMEGSLMDPMLSVGYQNEGLKEYNYGESPDAQWMFSLEQTFPWPGKLTMQEEAARLTAESEKASAEMMRREVVSRVTEAFYDLLLAEKELDLIGALKPLALKMEDIALARYSSGAGSQEDVLMAQAEKYMLLEREEMARSRRVAAEAMLSAETGSTDLTPQGRPVEPSAMPFPYTAEQLIAQAEEQAPELAMRRRLMEASGKRLSRSRKEALPDVTLMAKYSSRGGGFEDMYELTASVPLPLFYRSRQGAGVTESSWMLSGSRSELEAARARIAGRIRDDLAMVHASERIVDLYRNSLIPTARKGIDAALASFGAGRLEASIALSRLKAPFDYELAAWQQQVQREKAIARIRVYTGAMEAP
ncbi:MAG: TolC family protein [Desulfobacterota bacterium]|nr:TolC family protein [Thermodesulfobacteriota bacterium]